MPPGQGQPTPVVDPVEDINKPVVVKPGEQVPQGDVPGGAAQPEAHDRFRDEQYRGTNPKIEPGDKPDSMVKPVTLTGADGKPIQAEAYNIGQARYVVTQQGEKYQEINRNGVTTYRPLSEQARARQIPDVPTARTTTQLGEQPLAGNNRRQQPVETADATGGENNRHRRPAADTLAVVPAVTDGKPLKDATGVQPVRKLELNENQRAAVQAYADAYKENPRASGDELRRMRELIPGQAGHEVQSRIREGQAVAAAIADIPVKGRQHDAVADVVRGKPDGGADIVRAKPEVAVAVPVPLKDNIPVRENLGGRDPLKGGIQVEGGADRTARQLAQEQIAALRAQREQLDGSDRGQRQVIQEKIAELKAQVHNPPGERGEFRDGRGGQLDARQLQEIAQRQQREMPIPPAMEAKLKGNPDALAILNQSWKDGKDREGKGGELGMRGRPDAGDHAAHALDALKGGQNQKGIPGFDINDKATREFLNDAMKRLDLTKGQRVEDIFKGLDPAKADRLTRFLTEGSTDGKFNPARVKDLMGMSDQLRNPTDRLYDFLKSNKDLINNQQMSAKDTQRMLGDLTKILGDVNKQLGLDGGKNAINLQDVLGRKLDPTRPGERLAAMELNGINRQMTERPDALAMTARMTAAQEIALRQMLDLRNGRDPVAQPTLRPTGQEGMQAGRETGAGVRFEGAQTRMDAAQVAAQNQARMDGRLDVAPAVKTDVPIKAEAKGDAGRPDAMQVQKQQDIVVAGSKPIEAKGPDALAAIDRKDEKVLDERTKLQKKEEEEKEKHEKEEQHKREEKARLDALMLAALAEKKRKLLEQEQKEKEKSDEKDKQRDREKRRRYIVREKDTLQSIASAQLRDVKLSPLIYEINKEVIQLRVENGKQVPDLKPKMIIWLPSTTEIEEFRKGGIAGAKAAGTPQDKKMTADEELIARFGAGWKGGGAAGGPATGGPASGGAPTVIPGSQPATSAQVTAALAASAMEAAQKKRANIESLLGPIGRQKPADGRIKYIARLGDSLKSVAMKHPGLQDVNLWKLLAEINEISTEVDSRGGPVATLSRGAVLMIPSNVDVEEFRQRTSVAPHAVHTAGGVATSGVVTEVATKLCEGCGRMTVNSATICPACGSAFASSSNSDEFAETVSDDMNTVHVSTSHEAAFSGESETAAAEDAKTVFVAVQEMSDEDAPTRVTTGNQTIETLRDDCRLVKCDGLGIVCQLEVFRSGGWEPVVSYEIYDDVSLRNEHTQDGRKRTVRIDLPPPAARELASNDLNSNWKGYCGRFLGLQIN